MKNYLEISTIQRNKIESERRNITKLVICIFLSLICAGCLFNIQLLAPKEIVVEKGKGFMNSKHEIFYLLPVLARVLTQYLAALLQKGAAHALHEC